MSAAMPAAETYTGTDCRNPLYWRRSAAEARDPNGPLMRLSRTAAERHRLLHDAARYDFIAGWLTEHGAGFPSDAEVDAAARAAIAKAEGR